MHPSLFRGWSHAISFKCRIGDQPVVHPVNPAIHHVREQGSGIGHQKCPIVRANSFARVPSYCLARELIPGWPDLCLPTWWSQPGSNRRPQACKASALPTELWPRIYKSDQVVGPGRVERPTSRLSGVRSNHLSYEPKCEMRSGLDAQSRNNDSRARSRTIIDGRKGNEGGG